MRQAAWTRRLLPIIAVIVCGLCRLWYLTSEKVAFNADEAGTGIMARQIEHGHFYVFYAGQDYGGAIEAYLQAGTYLLLRLPPNPLTLRLPLVALSMATCAVVYLVGVRVLPTPFHAVLAAFVFAVSPWFNVVGGITSLGFYAAGQFTAIAAIYCALRVTRSPRASIGWALALGLVSGLALWSVVATVYVLVPIAFWIAPTLRRSWSATLGVGAAFLVGGLPLFASIAVRHRLPIPPAAVEKSSVVRRLANLFGPVLREFVGVTYAHANGGLPLVVQILIVAPLLGLYLLAVWHRRHGLRNLVLLRADGRAPADLLLAVPVVVVLAYGASDTTWYIGTPRYLLITYPLFAIAVAALGWRLSTRTLAASGAVLVLLVGSLSVGFYRGLITAPTTAQRESVFRQVTDRLEAEHETSVYGDYWTAIPLQYVAAGRLEVAVCVGSKRFPASQAKVAASASPVYITSPLDDAGDPIGTALQRHHVAFRSTQIGFVTIYDHIAPKVTPAELGLR